MKEEHVFQCHVARMLRMSSFLVINCDVMDAMRFLKGAGDRAYFANYHKMRGYTNGQPDLIAGKNGQFYALELKGKSGRLSTSQEKFKKRCEEEGLTYLVIQDYKDIDKLIKENWRGASLGGTFVDD